MAAWNFAVIVDAIAHDAPNREAVVHGERRRTWREVASRARSLAWYLHLEAALTPGDKVAIVLPNCPEYLEAFFAIRKLHCVPLNVDASSSVDALHRLIDATDAKVVVSFPMANQAARTAIRRIPKRWRPRLVEVGEPSEQAIAAVTPPSEWEIETPSADDLIFLATHDVSSVSNESRTTLLPVAPLAHGDGLAMTLRTLMSRGRIVFVDSKAFDPRLVWQTVEKEGVDALAIGGDAFARPLLAALANGAGVHSLTTLRTISSSGAPLSPDVASALMAALPDVTIHDAYDSHDAPEPPAPGAKQMIHPSEVEEKLRKHSSISDCVVLGVSDPRIGKTVVAIVQISENHYLDAPELAAWCRAHLPSFMTPGQFVFVEKIERSPSGEADYQALLRIAIDQLVGEP